MALSGRAQKKTNRVFMLSNEFSSENKDAVFFVYSCCVGLNLCGRVKLDDDYD